MRSITPNIDRLPRFDSRASASFSLSVIVPVYNERHVVETSLRRVLALEHDTIQRIELIVVDDRSTDGSWDVLERLAEEDDRIILVRHEENRGKGAAIRTGLNHATCDITIVHDADLEYDPSDIPSLLIPFAQEGADAVFGSRYLSAAYRRALMHKHTLMNKGLTFISNCFTDLHLTDLETCYKAVNTTLLKSIPIRSNDFRIEVEIPFKLAKRRARVFESPIRYSPRTFAEGKKIRAWDGVLALLAMIKFWLVDDLYKEDEYGSHILSELERAHRFNLWMGETLRPYVGDRVLEIGAGIGNLTNQFIPRELYVASDINPNYLHYLRSYSFGKPYLRVAEIDASLPEHFEGMEREFDTALMINVLEHVPDEQVALRNLRLALRSGGRAVILVPQHPSIYGSLDRALEHKKRYTRDELKQALTGAGFHVEKIFDFNRVSVPGWFLNGRILRKKTFSRLQLKLVNTLVPLFKIIDRLFPWSGLSIIAVARVREENSQ